MADRENKVETYLREQVKQHLGGTTRKWASPGVDGVMDQIIFSPIIKREVFCEVKTVDGELAPWQIREAGRLRDAGALVTCVWGHGGVDQLIRDLLLSNPVKREYR